MQGSFSKNKVRSGALFCSEKVYKLVLFPVSHTVHLKQSGAFDCHILRSSEVDDELLAPDCARSVIVVPLIQR
jgi:hypothetical protein